MKNINEYTDYWVTMASTTHPHWWQTQIESGKPLRKFIKDRYNRYKNRYGQIRTKKAT